MNPWIRKWGFSCFLCGSFAILVAAIAWSERRWEEEHCVEVSYTPAMDHMTSMGDRITIPAQTVLKCDNGRIIIK